LIVVPINNITHSFYLKKFYRVQSRNDNFLKVNSVHNPVVFMFSGQGSQYYQMGKELYYHNPVFKRWLLHLDNILYQKTGYSIVAEIYNKSKSINDKFDQFLYSHPAIFMVEYALAQTLIERGLEPDYFLGASLGEFTAAAITGILSVEEVLECILKHVELAVSYCRPGSMIAIMGSPELFDQTPAIHLHSELSAVNYSNHFVVSGASEELYQVEHYLKNSNILYQTLPVQYGFHSANIDPIEHEYRRFLAKLSFQKPKIPVISCLNGYVLGGVTEDLYWRIIREPIHFQKTILELERKGTFHYIDLGPFSTLAGFTKKNLMPGSQSQCHSIITPFHQEIKNIQIIESSILK
jgi:bacillaene synthase trans-acting acyltransferase